MHMSKQRLVMVLASAGVPVDRVTIDGKSVEVTYMEWATQSQWDQGAAIVSEFDPSPEAEVAWQLEQKRSQAKQALGAAEPMPLATRAACYALMVSLQEAREKINAIIAAVNTATGSEIELLATGDSYAAALETVAQIIDAGVA